MRLKLLAPAKVNLFLHVGATGADGYHPISSWMAFADYGDEVSIGAADDFAFDVDGPFAGEIPHDPDNLVLRARDELLRIAKAEVPPFRLLLTKRLPVASGLGGGSSDAAATLRLLAEVFELDIPPLLPLSLGSDVPACLAAESLIAEGRGEVLQPAPAAPSLHAVLVNPGVPSPTGAVYAAYDRAGAPGGAECPDLPPVIGSAQEAAAILSICRNDLEAPAIALEPRIGEALDVLRDQPETLIGRMSGSGATCFALCQGATEAETLAGRVQAWRPDWWVQACRLGDAYKLS